MSDLIDIIIVGGCISMIVAGSLFGAWALLVV
mgnify:CR=1 FL=1|jgi:hypothetical protein